jgi:hypothetical protein
MALGEHVPETIAGLEVPLLTRFERDARSFVVILTPKRPLLERNGQIVARLQVLCAT